MLGCRLLRTNILKIVRYVRSGFKQSSQYNRIIIIIIINMQLKLQYPYSRACTGKYACVQVCRALFL